MDLLAGEGIAVGEPITNGDLDQPEPAPSATNGTGRTTGSKTSHKSVGDPNNGTAGTNRATGASSATVDGGTRAAHDLAAEQALAGPADFDTPWPQAPADPDLLNPAAEHPPAEPAEHAGDTEHRGAHETLPEPPAQDEGDAAVDPDHEHLRPYWLADFHKLATTPPACPHCGNQNSTTGPLPAPRRGVVDLQMSIYTLMHLDQLPAELAGYGPLLADIARQVIAERPDLQWRFSVYNEINDLIAHDITHARPTPSGGSPPPGGRRTRRRPSDEVAAFVRARNRTCVAPGCRRPAKDCELDHTVPWPAGGESEPDNLGPACKGHHMFKHSPGCQLVQINPGVFGWQTPKGLQYMTTPTPPLYDDTRYLSPNDLDIDQLDDPG